MSQPPHDPEPIDGFLRSLPSRYRESMSPAATIVHLRLANERGADPVRVGRFPSDRADTTALCVVADDRAGLLATISAALVLHGLDVVDAEMYTRDARGERREAIDLFWVRRTEGEDPAEPLTRVELDALAATLNQALPGAVDLQQAQQRASVFPRRRRRETVVRFIEGQDGLFSTLEVEAGDRPGLLLALSTALFEQRLQIISSEAHTREDQIFDRFTVIERDGAPVSPARRLEIQVSVMTALEEALRR